jgi:CPA1 family monovalent cation:H+ antiporter
MSELEFVALVLAAIGPLLALAKLTGVPQLFLLAGAGLGSALLPGLPPVRVDPQFLLSLFLPPLLYAGTVQASVHLLRFAALTGVLVGALVSVSTILAVAAAARWLLLPGLGWAPALLLGVVAAVFDTRLFQEAKGRPQVPRAVADALKAREMTSRVVALSALSLVVGSLETGPPDPLLAAGGLLWAIGGGAALGAAVGRAIVWLRERVEPAPVEIAVSIATPYLCSLGARWLGLSVVVAITAAALTVAAVRVDRETGAPRTSAEARISAVAFWEEVSLLVSSAMFFLAGRALPEAVAGLNQGAAWGMAGAAAALLGVVLAVQFAFAFASTALPPLAAAMRERSRGGTSAVRTRAATAAVMVWACTRSVIGLVVALSLPPGLEDRGLVLVVAALLILGSVLLQGLTLRPAVRAAALGEEAEDKKEVELATRAATAAAERSGAEENDLDAARRALFELRERDRIGDEALRKMLREADLKTRAAEGPAAALPGAPPPSP